MIYLDTATKKLQIVLGGAVTTSALEVSTHFFDVIPQATTTLKRGGEKRSTSNNTTDVDIVDAPGVQGRIRNIHTISIYNKDSVSATVTVKLDDGGTETIIVKRELDPGGSLQYEDTTGWTVVAGSDVSLSDTISNMNCRLTLTSGTAVTTSDVTGAETIYLTPFMGNRIWLFDGTSWNPYAFSELSGDVPDAAQMNDVFVYDSSGTLTLDIVAWTNDTTRATGIVLQNGVYVKSGATGRRYVGSFYSNTTGNGQTEDSLANRFVWNYYNRRWRPMRVLETTNSWTYSTATYQNANASTANRLNYCVGVVEDMVWAEVKAFASGDADTATFSVAAAPDGSLVAVNGFVTTPADAAIAAERYQLVAAFTGFPAGVGKRDIRWMERGAGSGTQTWYGDQNAPTIVQSGIYGGLWA